MSTLHSCKLALQLDKVMFAPHTIVAIIDARIPLRLWIMCRVLWLECTLSPVHNECEMKRCRASRRSANAQEGIYSVVRLRASTSMAFHEVTADSVHFGVALLDPLRQTPDPVLC